MQKLLQRQNLNFPLNYYQHFSTAALWFVSVCVQLTEERCYVTTFLLDRSLSSVSYVWKKESKWSGKSWCKLMVFSVDSQFLGVLKSFMLKWGDQILQHCSLILVSRIMEIWTDPIQKLTHFFVGNTDLDFDINPSKKRTTFLFELHIMHVAALWKIVIQYWDANIFWCTEWRVGSVRGRDAPLQRSDTAESGRGKTFRYKVV